MQILLSVLALTFSLLFLYFIPFFFMLMLGSAFRIAIRSFLDAEDKPSSMSLILVSACSLSIFYIHWCVFYFYVAFADFLRLPPFPLFMLIYYILGSCFSRIIITATIESYLYRKYFSVSTVRSIVIATLSNIVLAFIFPVFQIFF